DGDENEEEREQPQRHNADTSKHPIHRPHKVGRIATNKVRRTAPDAGSHLHKICKRILKACESRPARLHSISPWSVPQPINVGCSGTIRGRAIMSDFAAPAVESRAAAQPLFKLALAAGLAAIADVLFYDQRLGLSVAIFAITLVVSSLAANPV